MKEIILWRKMNPKITISHEWLVQGTMAAVTTNEAPWRSVIRRRKEGYSTNG